MNRKFKFMLFVLLFAVQIIINLYFEAVSLNLDLLYLVLVYVAMKSGYVKSLVAGTLIGLVADYFSGNILGVFGFSRTIAAYLLHELSRRIDLKNNFLVFLLIAISLGISNLIANLFFYFILGFGFNLSLLIYQPVLTGIIGLLFVNALKSRKHLDVY